MIENFVDYKVETSDDTRQRVVAALGLDEVPVEMKLNRGDFSSDEEFFDAAALLAVRNHDETYRREYERIRKQYVAQQRAAAEAAAAQKRKGEIAQKIKTCTLSQTEQAQVDDVARQRAQADFAAGRISFQEFGQAVERYAEDGTETAKRDRVLHDDMNARLRMAMREARGRHL